MTAQEDMVLVDTRLTESTIKEDLKTVDIPGALYYRGVDILSFTRPQLIKIIYLLTEHK